MENTTIFLASNLRYLRLQKNKTLEEVSKYVGKSYVTINYWENGKREPCVLDIAKLSNYYNIPIDLLILKDLSLYNIEQLNQFETIARNWAKSNNRTSEEKQRFLRELSRLIDEEEN